MAEPIISIRSLSKRYRLGNDHVSAISLARRLLGRTVESDLDSVWALRNINLNIADGERVGIIGKNGAGKSTLLKILSRINYPTTGEVIIRGRVTSLLEVGTGFSEDLTGLENIYLNATLNGLSRLETDERLDRIVSFSEIPKFLNTPIKHYSSGMRMRLAFSVAAHLDPDILMLDEVLAVGDLSFQKKCLERMGEMTSRGRTLLFVSHSIESVNRFCDRCIWLDQGQVRADGETGLVTEQYVKSALGVKSSVFVAKNVENDSSQSEKLQAAIQDGFSGVPRQGPIDESSRPRSLVNLGKADLIEASIVSASGRQSSVAYTDDPVGIRMKFQVSQSGVFVPSIGLHGPDGTLIFWSVPSNPEAQAYRLNPGQYAATTFIPRNFLNLGAYSASFALSDPTPSPMHRYFVVEKAVEFFAVDPPNREGGDPRGAMPRPFKGLLRPLLEWDLQGWGNRQ